MRLAFDRPRRRIASQAVARWSAEVYDAANDRLTDLSGNGLHARLGSAVGADTNDPTRLVYAGAQYSYFPGVANNNVTVTLAASTLYDYTVTYSDNSTASGTTTSSGAGVVTLGDAAAHFTDKRVKTISLSLAAVEQARYDSARASSPWASLVDILGKTWTLNRSANGKKLTVVDRTMLLLGTDDYLEVADNDLLDFGASDSFTVALAARLTGAPSSTETLMAKRSGLSAAEVGWFVGALTTPSLNGRIADGAVQISVANSAGWAAGVTNLIGIVRDTTADTLATRAGGVANSSNDTTTATLSNSEVMRIGRLSGAATVYGNFLFTHAAAFRRALSDGELARLAVEWGVA